MKSTKILMFLAVAAITAAPLIGQDETSDLRRQLRNNVGTLRILRLTQSLNLTEEQAAKIYPMITRMEREKLGIQVDLAKDLQDIRKSLGFLPGRAASPDKNRDDRLLEAVRRISDCRRRLRTKEEELEDFLTENLTPIQQARYVLFQIDFNQGLGEALNRARMKRQGQLLPGAPIKK